jgi:hypothetical protein
VVAGVVDFHCFGVEVGFEGGVGVGEEGEGIGHCCFALVGWGGC